MTRDECYALIKQYSNDTLTSSFIQTDHSAFRALLAGGEEIIPFVLERLKNSVGRDSGDTMDYDNDPWLTISVLTEITNGACVKDFPEEYYGMLDHLREYVIKKMETQ